MKLKDVNPIERQTIHQSVVDYLRKRNIICVLKNGHIFIPKYKVMLVIWGEGTKYPTKASANGAKGYLISKGYNVSMTRLSSLQKGNFTVFGQMIRKYEG